MIQGDLPSSSLPLAQDSDLFPAFTSKNLVPAFGECRIRANISVSDSLNLVVVVCFKITNALFIRTHKSTALTVQDIYSLFLCRIKKKKKD